MKKILILLLVLSIAFTLYGCGGSQGETSHQDSEIDSETELQSENLDTDTIFVKDGESDYVLVIPEDATTYEKNAANIIADYIELSTDTRLGILTESNVEPYDDTCHYIMVGNTVEAQNLGVDYSSTLLSGQGFKIITEGDSTFLLGGGEFGTLFSAYEFLKYYIAWDCVAVDEINYTKTSELYFKDLNVTEIPDFEYRVSGNRQTYDSSSTAQLFRYITASGNGFMSTNGRIYHNCFEYLPTNVYNNPDNLSKYHPKWYSAPATDNDTAQKSIQLCYTAHGDSEEYELMQETCLQLLKNVVSLNPNIDNVQLSMADNGKWCTCDACREFKQKYGTNSAVVIKFCNDLHDKLNQWLEESNSNRKINLVFFAYHETTDAPVKVNDDGTYSLIDGFKCNEGVSVFYAPVYADYTKSFKDEVNYNYYKTMEKWSLVSDRLFVWFYSTNFQNYLIPYGNFSSIQDNFKLAKEFNVNYLFSEGQHYNSTGHPSGFTYLKEYLESQLMWNVDADVNALTDNFFDKYFKLASEPMRKYYEELQTNFDYMYNVAGAPCGIFNNIQEQSYFGEGLLRNWLDYIQSAYESIEPLKKTDVESYDKVKERIRIESISVRYLYLSLYGDSSDKKDVELMKGLKEDLLDLGFSETGQGTDVKGVWTGWGI